MTGRTMTGTAPRRATPRATLANADVPPREDPPPPDAPPDRSDAIRQLAYQYFLERGSGQGHELDDWLKAEAQILATGGQPPGPDAGTPS